MPKEESFMALDNPLALEAGPFELITAFGIVTNVIADIIGADQRANV
jgi:hypothetical protein